MKVYWVILVTLSLIVLVVCAIYLAAPPSSVRIALSKSDSAYTTADLIAAVTKQLTSIDSVYCEGVMQFVSHKPKKYRYARSGDMWHYMESTNDGKESTSCHDGKHEYTFIVGHPWENPKSWTTVQLHDPRKNDLSGPDGLLGAVIGNLRCSIADVLGSARNVTQSEEALPDGTPGFRLVAWEVAPAIPGAEERYTVAVTLDPAHDLLPREVLVTRPDIANWSEHWKVLEYRQVLDEQTGKKRWFPVSGTKESADPRSRKLQLKIDNVRINGDLPSTLFHPEIPNGVTLMDVSSGGKGTMGTKPKPRPSDPSALKKRITSAFSSLGKLEIRLNRALEDARLKYQWVLIVSANPQSDACQQLFSFFFEDKEAQKALADYLLLPVNANVANTNDMAVALKSPLKINEIKQKQPLLWVVDGNGKLHATADLEMISKNNRIDLQRLVDFLKVYAPKQPDAKILLADALAQAEREDKCVLLEESGVYCGWCVILARFIESHKTLLAQDYVPITIDRNRFGHGHQVMDRLRTSSGGIPWMAILDSKGKVLITSDGPKGNIGYPAKPEEIEYFLKMLKTKARRLTSEQLATLQKDLETAKPVKAAKK